MSLILLIKSLVPVSGLIWKYLLHFSLSYYICFSASKSLDAAEIVEVYVIILDDEPSFRQDLLKFE